MGRNLSNLYISESFQYLVQTSGSEFQNGLGTKLTGSYDITVANAGTATSALVAVTSVSSSYATFATTASYALNVLPPINTGSFVVTASVTNATTTFTKADGSTFNTTINNVTNASSASVAISSSYALQATSASYSNNSTSASYSLSSTTSSYSINGLSASYSNLATTAETASYATNFTASNILITGLATVASASITYLTTIYETASVVYSSGSNIFGDASNDVQTLYGTVDIKTGPLLVTGSINASGSITAIGGFTGSLIGTASYSTTASYAETGGAGIANPIGSITMYGGSSAPTGWLFCDGAAYSRSTYSALYSVLGDSFGNGDGSLTFNVPNYSGRMPIGVGSGSGLTPRSLAVSGGFETQTLTAAQMPPHSHSIDIPTGGPFGGSVIVSDSTGGAGVTVTSSFSGGVSGSAQSFSIMNPFLGINFIIKY